MRLLFAGTRKFRQSCGHEVLTNYVCRCIFGGAALSDLLFSEFHRGDALVCRPSGWKIAVSGSSSYIYIFVAINTISRFSFYDRLGDEEGGGEGGVEGKDRRVAYFWHVIAARFNDMRSARYFSTCSKKPRVNRARD